MRRISNGMFKNFSRSSAPRNESLRSPREGMQTIGYAFDETAEFGAVSIRRAAILSKRNPSREDTW